MAEKESFKGINVPSQEDLQTIIQLPSDTAKEYLAEKLGIPPYHDAKDPQKAPFVNYIYENIMFAGEKGFSFTNIAAVVKFAHVFLKSILVENHCLSDAIKDFHKKAHILEKLSDRQKQQYTDFIFDTVLTHYNLYLYVFSHLREIVNPKLQRDVHIPEVPMPLGKGYSLEVWEYNEKVRKVEQKEADDFAKLQKDIEKKNADYVCNKTIDDIQNVPLPYSKMSVEELVKEVLRCKVDQKALEFQGQVEATALDLSFKTDKTAVPRPAHMGEPPRFKPRTPASQVVQKEKNKNNSAKSPRSAKSPKSRASTTSAKSKK